MGLTTTGTGKPGNATYKRKARKRSNYQCCLCGQLFTATQPSMFDCIACKSYMRMMIKGRASLWYMLETAKQNHNTLILGNANANQRDRMLEFGWIEATETKDLYILTPFAHEVYDYVLAHR